MSFVQPSSCWWLTDASLNASILPQRDRKRKPDQKSRASTELGPSWNLQNTVYTVQKDGPYGGEGMDGEGWALGRQRKLWFLTDEPVTHH